METFSFLHCFFSETFIHQERERRLLHNKYRLLIFHFKQTFQEYNRVPCHLMILNQKQSYAFVVRLE